MRPPPSLNDDIRLLGRTLGDVIADQCGAATLDLVEAIRRAAVFDPDPARLIDLLDPLPIADALHVIRAFSYFAMLANIAEDTDHARRRRSLVDSGTAPPSATLDRAIRLIGESGVADDDVRRAVAVSEVVPVLT
ncbi:MAG TPA: phosphoenolpyruvate carboxylase, partial [Ilumatobacteraceae bacterium]|nr:phosphoenolpyruvate carboxylase [Ilumatobacteraceae bacterium]